MVGATMLFVRMNAGVKLLNPHLPVELIWARSLGHLLFVIAVFGAGHRQRFYTTLQETRAH